MTNEEKFYRALESLFIGAKIEGEGGFVNLMGIKSSYYSKIKELLEKDIKKALEKYPKFKEELFDKLYSFFNRYFTKSGSIYFNYTPFFQNVYDKVYTDDEDVILFWKTRMLYYVKTDRIFKNLKIEIEGKNETYQFFFDVSNLEYKKANEKRNLVYQFKKISSDGTIFFDVFYSEKGRQTKYDEIKKSLKEKGIKITDEVLDKAFSTFEAQSEVDYFINKNAKEFLQEQFKIWLYQYIYSEETEWPKERIDELQILKNIAFKIINFIYQFEDELVKIWNKPKFVLNSNYVITLDRIAKKNSFEIIEKIQKHKNFNEQVKEWEELGILEKEPDDLLERTLTDPQLKKEYQFLPIDTKYFKDLEFEILSLFDNLDQSLDGWLIKSENYQALNTILPKFREKVQTIYIDPPFNKEQDADYLYNVKYKDSSWITLLENRLQLAKDLLNEKGSIFTRCDYNGNMYVRLLMNEIFGEENFRNEIQVKRITKLGFMKEESKQYTPGSDSLFWFSKNEKFIFFPQYKKLPQKRESYWHSLESGGKSTTPIVIEGRIFSPRPNHNWKFSQERIDQMYKEGRIRINEKAFYIDIHGNKVNGMPEYLVLPSEEIGIDTVWTDIPGYSAGWNFRTENSEILLKRVIESTSNENDLVMDFFLGSGTTTAVAHKLGRKWIGVEMGEHFYTVVLPRMKKVLAYDKSGISKELKTPRQTSSDTPLQEGDNTLLSPLREGIYEGGGFFKYYELEQYEETLANTVYENHDMLIIGDKSPYEQYVFMKDEKMLKALEIDYENKKVNVDLSKIYPPVSHLNKGGYPPMSPLIKGGIKGGIDIAETLSNLTGKWIKKITPLAPLQEGNYEVEFEDGSVINTKDLDYRLIKPLIWWE